MGVGGNMVIIRYFHFNQELMGAVGGNFRSFIWDTSIHSLDLSV